MQEASQQRQRTQTTAPYHTESDGQITKHLGKQVEYKTHWTKQKQRD